MSFICQQNYSVVIQNPVTRIKKQGARAAVPAFVNAHPPRRYAPALVAHVEKSYTNANLVYMSRESF